MDNNTDTVLIELPVAFCFEIIAALRDSKFAPSSVTVDGWDKACDNISRAIDKAIEDTVFPSRDNDCFLDDLNIGDFFYRGSGILSKEGLWMKSPSLPGDSNTTCRAVKATKIQSPKFIKNTSHIANSWYVDGRVRVIPVKCRFA